jgi:Obg family GTPase CgtA-like protein
MLQLLAYLSRIGVDAELRRLGAKNGSSVMIDDFEFEYFED